MNKIELIGRLTRNPETVTGKVSYSRYTLAVPRKYKVDNQQEVDFINCIAFGKLSEFVEKYLSKGKQIAIVGRLQINNYDDKDGNKRTSSSVVVEEHFFIDGGNGNKNSNAKEIDLGNDSNTASVNGFSSVEVIADRKDCLPF